MNPASFLLMMSLIGISTSKKEVRIVKECPPDEAFRAKMENWVKTGKGPKWFTAEKFHEVKELEAIGKRIQGPPGCKFDEAVFLANREKAFAEGIEEFPHLEDEPPKQKRRLFAYNLK